jgi:hypothetical protein
MFSIYHRTQIIRRATAAVLSAALVTGTYAAVIPVGSNFFETVPGLTATFLDFTRASITRGFFDPGSDFFIGFIRLRGNPIEPCSVVFSGPYLQLTLRPATATRG